MEETAQLVPSTRIPLGEATLHSPPQTPLSLFPPSGLRITLEALSLTIHYPKRDRMAAKWVASS
ncbi:MAG: hypothetical protein HYW48_07430 [Deltaproteobacteria bacterium]|nr:hypothetical protein [Deltaproteobacteria bacterium]